MIETWLGWRPVVVFNMGHAGLERWEASRERPEMKIINRVSKRVHSPLPAFPDAAAERARELRGRIQLRGSAKNTYPVALGINFSTMHTRMGGSAKKLVGAATQPDSPHFTDHEIHSSGHLVRRVLRSMSRLWRGETAGAFFSSPLSIGAIPDSADRPGTL